MTRKDFWIQAYLACLHRYDPNEAAVQASHALQICDKQWEVAEVELIHRLTADAPVGEVNPRLQGTTKVRQKS